MKCWKFYLPCLEDTKGGFSTDLKKEICEIDIIVNRKEKNGTITYKV